MTNNNLPFQGCCPISPIPKPPKLHRLIGPPEPQGPQGVQGIQGSAGAKGLAGPGSTLFVTAQQGTSVSIPPSANDLFLMEVQVTTTLDNQLLILQPAFNMVW